MMATYSTIKKGQQFLVRNADRHEIAEIHKLHADQYEKGNAFIYRSKTEDKTIHLGIKKGRLLFAEYLLQVDQERFTLQDHKAKSLLYYAVVGSVNGNQMSIEENWDGHLEVKVEEEKVAVLKPFEIRTGADIHIIQEADQELYLPVLALFYFMYQAYKKESDFIEDLIEEVLDF